MPRANYAKVQYAKGGRCTKHGEFDIAGCCCKHAFSKFVLFATRSSWAGAPHGMTTPAPTGMLASLCCASVKCHAFIPSGLKGGCERSWLGAVFPGLRLRLLVLASWRAAFLTEALLHIFLKALLWRSGRCSVESLLTPNCASMACCGPQVAKRQVHPLLYLTAAGWPALHAALSPAPWAGFPSAIARPTACHRTWPRLADS